jgi:hypothetical protein
LQNVDRPYSNDINDIKTSTIRSYIESSTIVCPNVNCPSLTNDFSTTFMQLASNEFTYLTFTILLIIFSILKKIFFSLLEKYGKKIGLTGSMISIIRKKLNLSKKSSEGDSLSKLTNTLLSDVSNSLNLNSNQIQPNTNNNNLDGIFEEKTISEIARTKKLSNSKPKLSNLIKSLFCPSVLITLPDTLDTNRIKTDRINHFINATSLKRHPTSSRNLVTIREKTIQKSNQKPKPLYHSFNEPIRIEASNQSEYNFSKSNLDIRQGHSEQLENSFNESDSLSFLPRKTSSSNDLINKDIKNIDLNLFKKELNLL